MSEKPSYEELQIRIQELEKQLDEKQSVEEELERFVELSPSFIGIGNIDGCYVKINPTFTRKLGYTSEEFCGIPAMNFIHEDDLPKTKAALKEAQNGARYIYLDNRYRCKDGSYIWIDWSILALADQSRFITYGRDISERKRLEQELKRRMAALTQPLDSSEGLAFEDLFNLEDIQRLQDQFSLAAGVASSITKPDGTPITRQSNFHGMCRDIIRKNEKGRERCFRSAAELGKVNKDGPKVQRCLSAGLWEAGAGISVGGRHVASWLIGQVRDESQTEEEIRAYAREIDADQDAAAKAFYEVPAMSREQFQRVAEALFTLANQLSEGAFQNLQKARIIEEFKKAQQTLLESEELFRAITETAKDAILVMNPEGRISLWNSAAENIFGYPREEALGKQLHSLLAPGRYRAEHRKALPYFQRTGEGFAVGKTLELFALHKDGHEIPVELSLSSFKGPDGWNAAGIMRDISERKKSEDALKESKRFLDNLRAMAYMTDTEGKVTWVNPAVERITGSPPEEVIGRTLLPWIVKEHRKPVIDAHQRSLKGESNTQNVSFTSGATCHITSQQRVNSEGEVVGTFGIARDITEKLRTEKALLESEELFRAITETAKDAILVMNHEGTISFWNSEAENIFGYSRKEVLGKNLHSLLAPERYREAYRRAFPHFQETGHGYAVGKILEFTALHKDGHEIPVELSLSAFKGPDGWNAAGIMRDITERKQAENALKESKLFLDNLNDIAYRTDREGNVAWVNPAVEKISGFSQEELIGKSFMPLFIAEDQDTLIEAHQRALRGESNDINLTFTNGSTCHVISLPRRNAEGEVIGSFGIARDITEKLRTEKALLESESRFKALHNASFGGIGIHDKGVILACNQGLADMTGYSEDELIGMNGLLLIAEKSRDQVMHNIMTGYEKPYEAVGLRKNGEEYPLRLEARQVPYKGKIVRTTEFRDISEAKAKEKEHLQLQARLQQAQKMEAIGTLAGGIAHDFNNILGIIVSYTQLCRMEEKDLEKNRRYLDNVLAASERAKALVKQILTFSRQSSEEVRPVNIDSVIREMKTFISATIPATIEKRFCVEPGLNPVLADPVQLQQVFMNLCTNASHAMEDGGGLLEVLAEPLVLEREDPKLGSGLLPGDYIRITIRDTGCGMDKETLARIFEPYFTTKETGKGTGLGLSVVYGIVKNHKGLVTVESRPGEGTAFKVYLPSIQLESFEAEELSDDMPRGSERILLVDDEEMLVDSGKAMLDALGYDVTVNVAARDALEMFREDPGRFDLLITDQTMPHMTGDMLAREVLRIRPGMPVIICTGFSEKINREKAEKLGLKALLHKPLTLGKLSQAVREALDGE